MNCMVLLAIEGCLLKWKDIGVALLVPFWCVFRKEFTFNVRAMEIMSAFPKRCFLSQVWEIEVSW